MESELFESNNQNDDTALKYRESFWRGSNCWRRCSNPYPLGICITDEEGVIVYLNEKYLDIYGYSREEMIGESFLMVVPPDRRQELMALHDRLIHQNDSELPFAIDVLKKDGTTITIHTTAQGFSSPSGQRFKVTTVTDISDQIRMQKMRDDAERVVRHDLKAPLTGILGFAELLYTDENLGSAQKEYAAS